MSNLLEIKNLSKTFSSFSLKDITFSIPGGSIMGMIGENGAGKTTTIKLILNELRPSSGEVTIFGLDFNEHERKIKQDIGVVFDDFYVPQEFTPLQIGSMLRHFFPNWDAPLYDRYLQQFDLPREQTLADFSKGMRMKLSLVSALSHHPKLLILDEATSGLDPVVRSEILDLLLEFICDEEHSILFSTHITSDLERVADYITYLHKGEVLFSESKLALLDSYGVLKCSHEAFAALDSADIVRVRKNSYGCEVLVKDRATIAKRYPQHLVDAPSIDEIMVFYGKEE